MSLKKTRLYNYNGIHRNHPGGRQAKNKTAYLKGKLNLQ